MAVIIKNVDIPDCCSHCKIGDAHTCKPLGVISHSYYAKEGHREPDCPLVDLDQLWEVVNKHITIQTKRLIKEGLAPEGEDNTIPKWLWDVIVDDLFDNGGKHNA